MSLGPKSCACAKPTEPNMAVNQTFPATAVRTARPARGHCLRLSRILAANGELRRGPPSYRHAGPDLESSRLTGVVASNRGAAAPDICWIPGRARNDGGVASSRICLWPPSCLRAFAPSRLRAFAPSREPNSPPACNVGFHLIESQHDPLRPARRCSRLRRTSPPHPQM